MRVAIIENTDVTHHGQVGVALHLAGALVDIYRPYLDGRIPQAGDADAWVVFGGPQSARDDALHGYLPHLAESMAERAGAGMAVLGICLGAQLFARGLGADNLIGAAPEFGWCAVEARAAGGFAAQMPARPFQWHSDTFTLPEGATHLARSAHAEVQAFAFGRAGLATQFHFEANRAVVRDWTRRFPSGVAAMQADWLVVAKAEETAHAAAAERGGLALAKAWLAMV